ncbi:hypothetical protein AX16_010491 [Volvariella volvacea WC 439]|nr:hypothetical protein AX16_010491 [Volvariella volvacea WC 439]
MADQLNDDFVPDDLVAWSDPEDDHTDIFYFSDQDPSTDDPATAAPDPVPDLAAKKRRREKDKDRRAKKRKLTTPVEAVEHSPAEQPPRALAAYLAALQTKVFPKLSPLELEDLHISESAIVDTTAWTAPRTLDQLVEFIIKVIPTLHLRLSQRSKSNGAPTLLYIAGAALRVADVTRVLKNRKLQGDKGGEVAKLFAKHFKLSEHVAYLKRTKVGAAVGTPGRIGKLLCDTDALSTSAMTHIIIDATHRDAKKRNILDIPETRDEVFRTVLAAPSILKGLREGKIKLLLF